MATRKKAPPQSTGQKYPVVVETFNQIGHYDIGRMRQAEPVCWNGVVSVEKYRITVEKVEEPVEVLRERVRKLWRACDNHHHRHPLMCAAAKYDLVLNEDQYGTERKDRP
jgi:hypothetical protein